jgi:hypothetical protein
MRISVLIECSLLQPAPVPTPKPYLKSEVKWESFIFVRFDAAAVTLVACACVSCCVMSDAALCLPLLLPCMISCILGLCEVRGSGWCGAATEERKFACHCKATRNRLKYAVLPAPPFSLFMRA